MKNFLAWVGIVIVISMVVVLWWDRGDDAGGGSIEVASGSSAEALPVVPRPLGEEARAVAGPRSVGPDRFDETRPATTTPLPAPTTGTIVGRIVEENGELAVGFWNVALEVGNRSRGLVIDAGAFRFEGVPPGWASVRASSNLADRSADAGLRVEQGEEHEIELIHRGAPTSSRIVLHVLSCPIPLWELGDENLRLTDPWGNLVPCPDVADRTWEDLTGGPYRLEVEHPHLEPWSQGELRPGQIVRAELTGNAAIALTVLDADGVALTDYGLSIQHEAVEALRYGSDPLDDEPEVGKPIPDDGIFRGILPRPFRLVAKARGYAPFSLEIEDLQPGETRPIVARLLHGANVDGVVSSTAERFIPDADLMLVPVLDSEEPIGGEVRLRTRSNAKGHFRFEDVTAGTWQLIGRNGPGLSAEQIIALDPGESRRVDLQLPPAGWLVGRVLGPPEASFDGLYLRPETSVTQPGGGDYAATRVAPNGSFRLGPLPAGEVKVHLVVPYKPRQARAELREHRPSMMEVARVVVDGETECLIDLRDRFPGAIDVAATLNGQPAAGQGIMVYRLDDEGNAVPGPISGHFDANGRVTLAPIPPGRWRLSIWARNLEWKHEVDTLDVLPNQTVLRDVSIPLFSGSVQVLTADDGVPLRQGQLSLHLGAPGARSIATDAEGRFELTAPPGRYGLRTNWNVRTEFEWRSSGPLTVRLERDE